MKFQNEVIDSKHLNDLKKRRYFLAVRSTPIALVGTACLFLGACGQSERNTKLESEAALVTMAPSAQGGEWVLTDALAELAELDASGKRTFRHLKEFIVAYSAANPQGAFTYTKENITNERERRYALLKSFKAWVQKDPKGALVAAAEWEDWEYNELADDLAEALWQQHGAEAQEWIEDLSEGSALLKAIAPRIAEEWAAEAPADAAAWVDGLLSSKAGLPAAVKVTSVYFSQDPQATFEWVATLPSGAIRENALAKLVESMMQLDPLDGNAMLNALPRGGDYDLPVYKFVRAMAKEAPDIAQAQAHTIEDAQLRDGALMFLENAALPPEE